MIDRRTSKFAEKLSMFMVIIAALGAFLVLLDVNFDLIIGNQRIHIGGEGFSADLKGAVVSLILIGGWNSVKEFWLGSSAGSEKKSDAILKIAESAPAATAAAVAAATGSPTDKPLDPIKADTVNVAADTATITTPEVKP